MFNKKLLFFAIFLLFLTTLYSFEIRIEPESTEAESEELLNATLKVTQDISLQLAPEAQAQLLPVAGKPTQLSIPAINVNAPVQPLGIAPDGDVGAPEQAEDISWFDASVRPGEIGSAILSGHSGIWQSGKVSVFDNLHRLQLGDFIYVTDELGIVRSFAVKELRVYEKEEVVPEIFNKSDGIFLNMITCHGTYLSKEGTYDKRLVVITELVSHQ